MTAAPPGELAAGTQVGQYRIERRLGSGGMGEVYAAVHVTLHKRVAIKVLHRQMAEDPVIVARFVREGQAASRIRHPHTVDVTDVGVIDGIPCLVMEYLDGEPLRALFRREGALPVDRLVDLMLPVIAAVDAAHRQGVVHRDLKPPNVFLARGLGSDVHPKVLDFGISKLVDQTITSDLTADSTFLGSPHYASPEAARGERDIDGRADQYSLGVILYEGLTGVRPFAAQADTFMTLIMAISEGRFPPPRQHRADLPEGLEAVVLRAMSLDKEARFASTGELGLALLPFASPRARTIWQPVFTEAAGAGPAGVDLESPVASESTEGGTLARGASVVSAAPSRAGPRPWLWAAAGALAVVVLGVAFFAVARIGGRNEEPRVTAASSAPEPTSYSVSVTVVPETATVELDGVLTGTGKLERTLTGDAQHVLRIAAPGYETVNVMFDQRSPPPARVALRPSAAPQASAPEPTAEPQKTARPPQAKPPEIKTDNKDPWAQ
ncbi:MAG: protein kinase [Polyangiaceae bacterium]|nr:protein kinase [Polyangiaceae bacterium]